MSPAATHSLEDDAAVNAHAPPSADPLAEFSDCEYLSYEEYDDDEDEKESEEIEIEEEVEVEEEYDDDEDEEEAEDEHMQISPAETPDINFSQEVASGTQPGSHLTPAISGVSLPPKSFIEDGVHNSESLGTSDRPLVMPMQCSYVNNADSKCSEPGGKLDNTRDSGNTESTLSKKDVETLTIKTNSRERGESPSGDEAQLSSSSKTLVPETSTMMRETVGIPLSMRDSLGNEANTSMHSTQRVKPMAMHSKGSSKQTASRSAASEVRTRSISPSAEFRDSNKRPAVICDFFVKGWCIKGGACRFLHIHDKPDNTNRLAEEGKQAAAISRRDERTDEGFKDIIQEPKLTDFPNSVASRDDTPIALHSSYDRTPSNGHEKMMCPLDDQHRISSLQKDELSWGLPSDPKLDPCPEDPPAVSSSFMDVGRDNHLQNWIPTDYENYAALLNRTKSPFFQNCCPPELQTCLSGSTDWPRPIDYSSSAKASSHPSSLDNMGYMRSAHCSSGDASLSRSNMRTYFEPSAWTGSLFSLKPFDRSPLHSQQLVGGRDYRASSSSSLVQSFPPFSGAEAEDLPLTKLSGHPLHCTKHEVKISSNDWEPSEPFQPSFFINPAMTTSPGSQYDPFQDSFDLSILGDKSSKFSIAQRTSVLNKLHQPAFRDLLLSSAIEEYIGDKSPVSSHNEVVPKEESVSDTDHGKEVPNTNRSHVNDVASHRSGGSRHKKEMRGHQVRQNNEIEVDQKTDADVQKESRTLRYFRGALIDFVKELLKPAWHEGKLNKDAHNAIVKRSVEKVLTTLQLHQIPTTVELTKLYLSSSEPKISKLVEGYITKYGKS